MSKVTVWKMAIFQTDIFRLFFFFFLANGFLLQTDSFSSQADFSLLLSV